MLCPVSTLYTPQLGICERCASGTQWHAIINRCNRNSTIASGLSAAEAWFRDRNHSYPQNVDHFFMVSQFCLDKHCEYLPLLRRKSSVLYNFIADADVAQAPAVIADDAPFLYCGRTSREKGLELLCEAFAQRPEMRLRIAGDGPLAPELKHRYAHAANITFLGKVDSQTLKAELRNARFSVAPSEWYENNPMAILESFAQGTPVLGARIGGIPELVIEGRTGFQFAPSNLEALVRALDKASALPAECRRTMGQQALDLIRSRHDETSYYHQLVNGYKRVMSARFARRAQP